MLEQRVQQQFFESADLLYQCADVLAKPVAQGAQALVACFSGGGKLLVASGTPGFAQHAAALMCGRFERERPPLAALALAHGVQAATQLLALGQPGDVLLLQDPQPSEPDVALLACVEAARQRELGLLLLTSAASPWTLEEGEWRIAVPHERLPRIAEVHGLILHALCDAVDAQLFGEASP